jgi:hypothetical protein
MRFCVTVLIAAPAITPVCTQHRKISDKCHAINSMPVGAGGGGGGGGSALSVSLPPGMSIMALGGPCGEGYPRRLTQMRPCTLLSPYSHVFG